MSKKNVSTATVEKKPSRFSKKKKVHHETGAEGEGGEEFVFSKLHTAKDSTKVLKYLGREGVDVSFRHNGDTPLHAYVSRKDKHKLDCLMTFLINAPKCDVDMLNDDGNTALHLACKNGDLLSAKPLIAFGADINRFNSSNQTPLDLAWHQSRELADLLAGIGGMDGITIMANLQINGSQQSRENYHQDDVTNITEETVDGGSLEEEKSFERLLNPDVMRINPAQQGPSIDGLAGGGDGSGDGEREEAPDNEALEGDKMPSIPEDESDDERYKTPDCSVEMGIRSAFMFMSCNPGTSVTSEVDEAAIVRNTQFFPKIDEDKPIDQFVPSTLHPPTEPRPHHQKRHSPLSRSPLSRSPRSGSPSSPRSQSPASANASPLSRSRSPSPSPLSRSRTPSPRPSPLVKSRTTDSRSPHKDASSHGVSTLDSEEKGEAEERRKLEEMTKNYTELFPSHEAGVGSHPDDMAKREGQGQMWEEKEESRNGVEAGDKRTGQGFVDYTDDGEFIQRLDAQAQAIMDRALENSLGTGDEGYAAWLQYVEIQKVKRERKALMLEEKDSKGEEKKGDRNKDTEWVLVKKDVSQPSKPLRPLLKVHFGDHEHPPSKTPATKHVRLDLPTPPRRHITDDHPRGRYPYHRRLQNPESSVMRSVSIVNPNMSVMESVLGKSVVPMRMKPRRRDKKSHRILCLDGGGVKGLVQIEVLRTIEKMAGAPIAELFDWIVGTSTGGIVVLGTVYAKLTLDDLRKIYFEMKEKVFKQQSKVLTVAYDTEALEKLLQDSLGTEARMSDVDKPKVMITAVDKRTNDLPLVFFNNCFDNEHSTQKVWKVARYTSAAPVFFKECDNYIDGGVIANNPCNFALAHIKQHLRKVKETQKKSGEKPTISTDVACLVSVGCGIFPSEPIGNTDVIAAFSPAKLMQLPARLKNTINMLTTALTKSEDQTELCRAFCEELEIPFYRFSPQVGELIGTAETDDIKLCDSIISTKKMLFENQDHLEELMKYLGCNPVPRRRITT